MRQGRPRDVTFVLGGARSGKSRFAQRLASGRENVIFIATATASDPEMEQRIARHRRSRPAEWQTLEVPLNLDAAILSLEDDEQLVIVDCLTIYLANVMKHAQNRISEIEGYMRRLCEALQNARAPIVIVSNEVGSGVHAATALGRLYCDLLGEFNQQVAALAQNVVVMMAGIPVPIKGRLPIEVQSGPGFDSAALQQGVSLFNG